MYILLITHSKVLQERFQQRQAMHCYEYKENRNMGVIMLYQEKYINIVFYHFNKSNGRPLRTPIEVYAEFEQTQCYKNDVPFREVVGYVLYVSRNKTRYFKYF